MAIATQMYQAGPRASRRWALGAVVGLGGAVVVAACGTGGPSASQPAAGAKTPVAIEHLDWWVPNTPVLTTYFDGIKKDFEGKNPHITVNYTFVTGTGGVREKWVVNAAGGTPHDSSQVSVAFIRDLMDGSMVEALDPYLQKTPHMVPSQFVDSGTLYNTFQGKKYGIPYDGPAMNVVGYNLVHFKEAGLDPSPKFTWNWTVDQFLEAARKLVKTEGGRNVRGGFAPVGLSIANLLPFLYAHGGDFYSADYSKTLVNSQAGRQALQLLYDLRHRHKLAADVDGAALETEALSMAYTGSWTAGYLLDKNPRLQFGFAPIPKGPLGKTPSSQTWTNQWAINRESKKKDTAWEWLSFVNSEPVQEQYFATVMKRVSGRKQFYQSAAWKSVLKEFPALDGIEKMEPLSKQYPWVKPTPLNAETTDLWRRAQANEIGVNETLAQLEQIANRVLSAT